MKKIRFKLAVLSLSCAALAASLCGCNIIGNGETDVGGSTVTPKPPVTDPVTFSELVTDYTAQAKSFFSAKIKPQIAGEREIKAESWYLGGEGNGVTKAALCYIYVVDENIRTLEIASADFKTSVKAQDIADDKANLPEVDVTRNAVFTFNAKDNYNNQDITEALYKATAVTSPLKLYSEAEANDIDRIFNIVETADDKITVTNLNVTKGDESKQTLLKNLANRAEYGFRETKSAAIVGVKINQSVYALENLGGGETNPDEGEKEPGKNPDPETPPDDTPVTNAQIIQALDENCLNGIVLACHPSINHKPYVQDGQWFITKNSDGNITEVNYLYRYQNRETNAYHVLGKIEFSTPIDLKDMKSADFENANYLKVGTTSSYNPTIQEENSELTNAICDVTFGQNTGAKRFIVRENPGLDITLKNVDCFRVIEVTDNKISQSNIIIKQSSSYEEYLSKLDNASNYRISSRKEYQISGEKLIAE